MLARAWELLPIEEVVWCASISPYGPDEHMKFCRGEEELSGCGTASLGMTGSPTVPSTLGVKISWSSTGQTRGVLWPGLALQGAAGRGGARQGQGEQH